MKIEIQTFGCSLNQADSERMASVLAEAGYAVCAEGESGDIVIINSCTVKQMAEKKMFKAISEAQEAGKKVVVAGCVAQAEQNYLTDRLADVSVIGTKQLEKIVHVVEETIKGNVIHLIDAGEKKLCMPKIRRHKHIGIVALSEGCLGECTYCKTRFARGRLVSHPVEAIVERVKADVADGCKEIWLTSQDCGAYGKDIETDIVKLLIAVISVEGDFKVRLGMANPNFVLEHLDDLIKVFAEHSDQEGKLFRFLHIPVQSGDDCVLRAMKRKYTVADFKEIVHRVREEMPDMTIATDIIVGFPGEGEEEFEHSLDLVREMQFDVVNKSRFWARPGTRAAEMPGQIHGQVSKVRSEKLKSISEYIKMKRNEDWSLWRGNIIIEKKGTVKGSWVGRNYAYKPVVVFGEYAEGMIINVEVKKVAVHHLEAEEQK